MIRLLLWLWAPVWSRLRPALRRTRDAALLLIVGGTVLWLTGATRGLALADDVLEAEHITIEVGQPPHWLTVEIQVRQPVTDADACPPPQSHAHVYPPCELGDLPTTAAAAPAADEPPSLRGEL